MKKKSMDHIAVFSIVIIRRNDNKTKGLHCVVNQLCCPGGSETGKFCSVSLVYRAPVLLLPAPDRRTGVKPVLLWVILCLDMSAF